MPGSADGPTVYDYAIGAIALLSLGVSAYNARRQAIRDARSVTVSCNYSFPVGGVETIAPELMVTLRVLNEGHRPVEITGVGFELPDGRQPLVMPLGIQGPATFPKTLQDGGQVSYYFDLAELQRAEAQIGQRIRHAFADASGKRYRGRYVKHSSAASP